MPISINKGLRHLETQVQNLEKQHGKTVDLSKVSDPALRELARPLATGCGSASVSIKDMKAALKTLGKDLAAADSNDDGKLTAAEQRALSSLSARLLEMATGEKVARPEPRPVSTGCGSSGGGGSVSSGCGSSAPSRPAPSRPAPAPSRPAVSSGCGSSAPSRPAVSTGCGSSAPARPAVAPRPAVTPRPIRSGC